MPWYADGFYGDIGAHLGDRWGVGGGSFTYRIFRQSVNPDSESPSAPSVALYNSPAGSADHTVSAFINLYRGFDEDLSLYGGVIARAVDSTTFYSLEVLRGPSWTENILRIRKCVNGLYSILAQSGPFPYYQSSTARLRVEGNSLTAAILPPGGWDEFDPDNDASWQTLLSIVDGSIPEGKYGGIIGATDISSGLETFIDLWRQTWRGRRPVHVTTHTQSNTPMATASYQFAQGLPITQDADGRIVLAPGASITRLPDGVGLIGLECTSCQTSCQSACTTGCETTCESGCQTGCELTCQNACESQCQTGCEVSCEGGCQTACMTGCQSGCQTDCETTCQSGCQSACEGACEGACEAACESGCQSGCEASCQTACMTSCETACQITCQSACQTGCQASCESGCTTGCEESCQSSCQIGCQVGCQVACQTGCQLGCQTGCQLNCQTTCETSCQSGCEASCQTGCEVTCEVGCEVTCETGCETGGEVADCPSNCSHCASIYHVDLSGAIGAWGGHPGKTATFTRSGTSCTYDSGFVDSDDYCERITFDYIECFSGFFPLTPPDQYWNMHQVKTERFFGGPCPGPYATKIANYTKVNTSSTDCPGGIFVKFSGDEDMPEAIEVYD